MGTKQIVVTGTGIETLDNSEYTIPGDQRVWSVIKPPKIEPRLSNGELRFNDFERIDCQFTGMTFEGDGRKVEVWAPLERHDEICREAESLGIHIPQIKLKDDSKPDPVATVTLESELDGDEWDLDNEDDDDPDLVPSFEDWWFGAREHVYGEMEKKLAEQLKATLLWTGDFNPDHKRKFTIRDIDS